MKYLKQFFSALKKLGLPIHPGVIALILLAIVLLVLFLRWRSKQQQAAFSGDAALKPVPARPPEVSQTLLLNIWRRFRGELPSMVRRSIEQFQPVIVLGARGSGKTQLITQNTDWQRQARYLFGSQINDPDLQIYLGSQVLAFELPAALLTSTARGMRDAYLTLWRQLVRRRTPVVVVTLDPVELVQMNTAEMHALADAIRGKINLLSMVRKRPIETRLAFTHMDQFSGFLELSQLVSILKERVLELDVSSTNISTLGHEMEAQLKDFEQLRPAALIHLDTHSYLKVLKLFEELPKALAPTVAFINRLTILEPYSTTPKLSKIYLCSECLTEPVSHPFGARVGPPDPTRNPDFRHKLYAGGFCLLATSMLLVGFIESRALWHPAREAVAQYENTELRLQPELESMLREEISSFVHRLSAFPFYWSANKTAGIALAKQIREDFVLHELKSAISSPDGVRKAIYLLVLLELNRFKPIQKSLAERNIRIRWSQVTGLSETMLKDYLLVIKHLPELPPLEVKLSSSMWTPHASEELLGFFREIAAHISSGEPNSSVLHQLRLRAHKISDDLKEIDRAPETTRLVELLAKSDSSRAELRHQLKPYLVELQEPELFNSALERRDLLVLSNQVMASRWVDSSRRARDYLELCQWITEILEGSGHSVEIKRNTHININGLSVREQDWRKVIRHQLIVESLRRFMQRVAEQRSIFFRPGIDFPSIRMNPLTRGTFLFSGNGRIPGQYTKSAFEQKVLPALECHARIQGPLSSIEAKVSREINTLVIRETEMYAEAYVQEMNDYYQSLRIETHQSVENLQVVLKQVQKGSSPLTHHLATVTNNARFRSASPEAQSLISPLTEGLEPFRLLGDIVTSTISGAPAYESYLLIMRQVEQTIAPFEEVSELDLQEGYEETLRERLSSVGQMTLDMISCAPESAYISVMQWMDDVAMPKSLRRLFLDPIREVFKVGRTHINKTVDDIWRRDILQTIEPILLKFPFNLASDHDVEPEELSQIFHPLTGQFTRLRNRLLNPLIKRPTSCHSPYTKPELPNQLEAVMTRVQQLATTLWDEDGQPHALVLAIKPVPFDSRTLDAEGQETEAQLTLTFIGSGNTTQVNFNQRPFARNITENWAKIHNAQIGVKLHRNAGQEDIYPDPIVESSHWALLRILARAERVNKTFSWPIKFRDTVTRDKPLKVTILVRYELEDDPFSPFQLRSLAIRDQALNAVRGIRP